MRIIVTRNSVPSAPRFKFSRLPVGQTLLWVGPIFVLVQRKA